MNLYLIEYFEQKVFYDIRPISPKVRKHRLVEAPSDSEAESALYRHYDSIDRYLQYDYTLDIIETSGVIRA